MRREHHTASEGVRHPLFSLLRQLFLAIILQRVLGCRHERARAYDPAGCGTYENAGAHRPRVVSAREVPERKADGDAARGLLVSAAE